MFGNSRRITDRSWDLSSQVRHRHVCEVGDPSSFQRVMPSGRSRALVRHEPMDYSYSVQPMLMDLSVETELLERIFNGVRPFAFFFNLFFLALSLSLSLPQLHCRALYRSVWKLAEFRWWSAEEETRIEAPSEINPGSVNLTFRTIYFPINAFNCIDAGN